tara:strand:+ start:916 stop:1068 length:153 start_codon:yes stop_codon:yes gene_type:complete
MEGQKVFQNLTIKPIVKMPKKLSTFFSFGKKKENLYKKTKYLAKNSPGIT